VNLRQDTPSSAVTDVWYQVRKKVGDIRNRLPQGTQGPFFNDEFGDTFGIIFAFSGDGWPMPELKKIAEDVRARLLRIKDVGKIELYGTQDPKVFVEFSHAFLANTGIQPQQIFDGLAREYAVTGTGRIDTATDRVAIRIEGTPDTIEAVRQVPFVVNGRQVRVGDVADVRLGTEDPTVFTVRFNGPANVAEQVVRANMQLQEGSALEDALIDRDIRSLYRTGQFEFIEFKRGDLVDGRIDLVVEITAKFRVSAVDFEGNSAVKAKRLLKEAKTKLNLPLDERQVKEDAEKIREYYQK
jgi:Cu/Ag efflux pump CusA